ncbi:unnamed protein product [Nippostrongylus brasiliensis]|uniref:Uncharacterized protein n=1 Tax=Nippostrongylus brasiliensis TaxID=27835 RepID=A0A0N4XK13_NIPBR|nr:unnamed protein product [Nippostrongylus brasiliensis]
MSNPSCAFECSPPPPYVIPIDETVQRINARSLKSNELKMEWIPITKVGLLIKYISTILDTLVSFKLFFVVALDRLDRF